MANHSINLSHLLISEHFGPIVANVAKVLMQNTSSVLGLIIKDSNQTKNNVIKSLKILIQHQFVTFETNDKGLVEYTIDTEHVLRLLRYPKYIYVSKLLFGDESEHMTEELLRHGMLPMSQTIERVVNRLSLALDESKTKRLVVNVYEVFTKLVEMHFIQRAHIIGPNNSECSQSPDQSCLYSLPEINLSLIQIDVKNQIKSEPSDQCLEPLTKKPKTSHPSEQKDLKIYWKINCERFDQYIRDQIIVDAILTHYSDRIAGEIARIILRLSEVRTHSFATITTPLSREDIVREALKQNICSDKTQVDQYLHCFQEDINFRFISKTEDRSDGMFSVNIMRTLDKLVENCLSSIVKNRYCSKSARIYRLLLEKKYLQQKQLEDYAMIPSKEAKQLTYNLFVDNMVKTLQCPKTADYAPSRTFFLFHVNVVEVSREELQRCFQSVSNAMTRRFHEVQQHKPLLERKNFIDAVISSLEHQQSVQDVEQQIQDLRDSFTTHDSELLEKVDNNVKKLERSELQIVDTMFLLQYWLLINKINSKDFNRMDTKIKTKF